MRLIDADRLLKFKTDHEMISTHLIWNAPTVDADPVRHGHWILKEDYLARCSNCGHQTFERKVVDCWADQYWDRFEMPRYCSNCGAKMDEEAEHG